MNRVLKTLAVCAMMSALATGAACAREISAADQVKTMTRGVNVLGYKLLGFVISGAMAGLAGGLFAFWNQSFSDKDFTNPAGINKALIFIVMVVVGGLGNRIGVIVASAFFAALAAIEITASGAISVSGGILSAVVPLATKCTGASMWVPVCSSNVTSLAKKPSLPSANFGVIFTGLNAGNTGSRGVNV